MSEQTKTTTRKIIQISACGVQENGATQCEMFLHTLCDDGTVWLSNNRSHEWRPVASIPQGEFICPTKQ